MTPAQWKLTTHIVNGYGYGMVAASFALAFQDKSLENPWAWAGAAVGLVLQVCALLLVDLGEPS